MILSKTMQKGQFAPELYSHHTVVYILLRCSAFLIYFTDFTSPEVFSMAFMKRYDVNLNCWFMNIESFFES